MMSLSPMAATEIVSVAQRALVGLNREFGTSVDMKVATVQDLRDWGLNPQFAGFVIQESPATIWIVPENIRVPDEALKTVYHEFQHIRDLTGACPFCTGPMRELRAQEFEALAVAGRGLARSAMINEALESLPEVLPQVRIPSDIAIPPECGEFLIFISDSSKLLVENAKLLGRLELLETEAARRGPQALRALKEIQATTSLTIDNEIEAILRETVRMAGCMNRLERQRLEEKFREIVKPVLGRVRAINEAIEGIEGHTIGYPIRICGPRGCRDFSNALLDTGSTFTTISPELAKELGFKGKGKEKAFPIGREEAILAPIGTLDLTIDTKTMGVPVIVMENVDVPVIGASTMEILGFAVDPATEEIIWIKERKPRRAKSVTAAEWFESQIESRILPDRHISGRARTINRAIDALVPDDTRYRMKLQAVIGELVAAQSHLAYLDPDMAAKIRGLKKRLQLAIWGQMA